MAKTDFVKRLNMVVVSGLVPFIDKYPVFKNILNFNQNPSDSWDFFMTIAGTGYLLAKDKKRQKVILDELEEFDKQGVGALNNFLQFLKTNKENEKNATTIVGYWVMWNIKNDQPTHKEIRELAPAIGAYIKTIVLDLNNERRG